MNNYFDQDVQERCRFACHHPTPVHACPSSMTDLEVISTGSRRRKRQDANGTSSTSCTYQQAHSHQQQQQQQQGHCSRPPLQPKMTSTNNANAHLRGKGGPTAARASTFTKSRGMGQNPPAGSNRRPRQAGAFSSKTKTGQGKVQTSIAYDYHPAGIRLPIAVMKVDYGEELYEKVVQDLNLANELASTNKKGSHKQKENLKEAKEAVMKEDKCRDFSTPAYHSSSRVTNELAKALDRLNTLPQDVASAFSKDERFQPLVIDRASKALRTPLDSEIFKELSPIQPNQYSKAEIAKTVCDQIKSVRPASRKKDPQPNILDHQTISYSRIKPGLPRFAAKPPPKPPASVSVDVRPSMQFNIIDSQQQFEQEADVLK